VARPASEDVGPTHPWLALSGIDEVSDVDMEEFVCAWYDERF
jgi:hypothetical protein